MKKRYLYWIIPLLLILNAFYHSALPAIQSDGLSLPIAATLQNFLQQLFSVQIDLDFINFLIRKGAHFLEYTAIGFSFILAYQKNSTKKKMNPAVLAIFLVPVIDETIQYFTPGRSCQLSDMLLDSLGILFGFLCFYLGLFLYRKITHR